MGILRPLTTNEFVLKSTMQLLAWRKSAPSNSSCVKSLHTYTVCCVVIPSRLISNTVVPRTSSGLLLAPRIGWCVRRNVLALVLILLNTSLCIIVTAAPVSTSVLTSMLLMSHRMKVEFSESWHRLAGLYLRPRCLLQRLTSPDPDRFRFLHAVQADRRLWGRDWITWIGSTEIFFVKGFTIFREYNRVSLICWSKVCVRIFLTSICACTWVDYCILV